MKKKIIFLKVIFMLSVSLNLSAQETLKVGDTAPNFELQASNGNTYNLSDFKGKMVVLDFWAMWCGPCKKKMPKIQELHKTYNKKGVEVLGMLAMNSGAEDKAKAYFNDKGYSFKLIYGNDQLVKDYGLMFLPTVTVIDQKGVILYHSTKPNPNEYEDIVKLIKEHS
ncbi:peroxiredoxin family protein [Flagellimonas onchidii]|uniref:peroxiredoxin family protein n=1 Tax=Flagellimonas onchidii TaxID=2562684 RepID=UPI0010A65500|nr:TlpA disulfide reductase family protein [Allomuricauda onchidii]